MKRAVGDALYAVRDQAVLAGRAIRHRFRMATRAGRLDPNLLIIGAAKSGTTALFFWLVRHPAAWGPPEKEIRYFDSNFERGRSWYRGHFAVRTFRTTTLRRFGVEPAIVEATPFYLFHPHVPERVSCEYPGIRLVAVLRDPVLRAYSHYQHQVRIEQETRPFDEAIESETELLAPELERMLVDPSYQSEPYRRFSYASRGFYLDQIERWLRFFPREQLLVLTSDDLLARPAQVLAEVLVFAGLPAWQGPSIGSENTGVYEPMPEDSRERLAAVFEAPNQRLYEFLGRDLGWIRPGVPASR